MASELRALAAAAMEATAAQRAPIIELQPPPSADAAIDPIKTWAEFLMNEGLASSEVLEAIRKEVDAEVNTAADIAIETPQPAPETAYRNVYSPDVDPTDRQAASGG